MSGNVLPLLDSNRRSRRRGWRRMSSLGRPRSGQADDPATRASFPDPRSAVDDEFVANIALSQLHGQSSPHDAERAIRDRHEPRARDLAQDALATIHGWIDSLRGQKRDLTQAHRNEQAARDGFSRYRKLHYDQSKTTKGEWTPLVWTKVLLYLAIIGVGITGSVLAVEGTLLSMMAFSDRVLKARLTALGFSVVPIALLGGAYEYLRKFAPPWQHRYFKGLLLFAIVALLAFVGSYGLLVASENASEISLDDTFSLGIETESPGQPALFQYSKAIAAVAQILAEITGAAVAECLLLAIVAGLGWPKLRARQENPDWIRHQNRTRELEADIRHTKAQLTTAIKTLRQEQQRADDFVRQVQSLALAQYRRRHAAVIGLRREFTTFID